MCLSHEASLDPDSGYNFSVRVSIKLSRIKEYNERSSVYFYTDFAALVELFSNFTRFLLNRGLH
ncbi:hypothetical protein OROMI_010135 [Orobanche minor]